MNNITKIMIPLRYILSGCSIIIDKQKYTLVYNTEDYLILTKEGRINEMTLHNFCTNCVNLNDGYVKTILDIMKIEDLRIELLEPRKYLLMLFYILLKGRKFNDILIDKYYNIIQRGKLIEYYTMNNFFKTFQHFTYKELEHMRGILL